MATRPSWPTTTMISPGSKTNRASSARSTVARRQRSGIAAADGGDGGTDAAVPLLDVLDPAAARAQEERGLPAGAVPVQQSGQLGPAVHEHGPRRQGRLAALMTGAVGCRGAGGPRQPAPVEQVGAEHQACRSAAAGPPVPEAPSASTVAGGRSWYARTCAASAPPWPRRAPACRSARARASVISPSGLGRDLDAAGCDFLLGRTPGVGALLVDQLGLAPGQLDLVLQLVLGDCALALDRDARGARRSPGRPPAGSALGPVCAAPSRRPARAGWRPPARR